MVADLKTTRVIKRKYKLVKKLKKKFGADLVETGTTKEVKEISDDEEEDDKDKDKPKQGKHQLTEGLGEDKDESAEEE